MPDKLFRVNIYEVALENETPIGTLFSNAIQNARGQLREDRYKVVDGKGFRLEHSEPANGYYLLNYVAGSYSGPGRLRPDAEIAAFAMQQRDSFAYQTAVLYDPPTNLVFMESNQGGMGPGACARYMREFSGNSKFVLLPRTDEDAHARANRQETTRKVMMRVSLGAFSEADRELGVSALGSLGERYGADFVNIELGVIPVKGRTLQSIRQLIAGLTGNEPSQSVQKLLVYGKEHDDDKFELIDLYQHREKRQLTLPVDDNERNVPYRVRWNALIGIRQEYLQ